MAPEKKMRLSIGLAVAIAVVSITIQAAREHASQIQSDPKSLSVTTAANPYWIKVAIHVSRAQQATLHGTTNLPDGTLYRLSITRDMHEIGNNRETLMPFAGNFEPSVSFAPADLKKVPTSIGVSKEMPFGEVRQGEFTGEFFFHSAEIQLFGCAAPKCEPDPNLLVQVTVDRDVGVVGGPSDDTGKSVHLHKAKTVEWIPADENNYSLKLKVPLRFGAETI